MGTKKEIEDGKFSLKAWDSYANAVGMRPTKTRYLSYVHELQSFLVKIYLKNRVSVANLLKAI